MKTSNKYSFAIDGELSKMLSENNISPNSDFIRQSMKHYILNKDKKQEEAIPNFRITGEIKDYREFFNYVNSLKGNPSNVDIIKAMYTEYEDPKARELLKRMSNPLDADIYLRFVEEGLKDTVKLTSLKEEINQLETEKNRISSEIMRLSQDIQKIKTEHDRKEKELEAILDGIPSKEKELQEMENTIANLRGDEGFARIDSFIKSVQNFIDRVMKDKGTAENERYVNKENFALMQNIYSEISRLLEYLKSEKWFSEARVDEKIKEQMNRIEEIKKENELYSQNHIRKNEEKALKIISNVMNKLSEIRKGPLDSMSRQFVESNLIDILQLLELNKTRADNIRAKSKEESE